MSVTTLQITTWNCDGPSCEESTEAPTNWIATGSIQGDTSNINRFSDKHFHSEECLENYMAS